MDRVGTHDDDARAHQRLRQPGGSSGEVWRQVPGLVHDRDRRADRGGHVFLSGRVPRCVPRREGPGEKGREDTVRGDGAAPIPQDNPGLRLHDGLLLADRVQDRRWTLLREVSALRLPAVRQRELGDVPRVPPQLCSL